MLDTNIMWLIFGVVIVAILILDLGVVNRGAKHISTKRALGMTALCVAVAMAFAVFVYYEMGPGKAMEFLAAYVMEESMSIDNIFVFIIIFSYFAIPDEYQHEALFYGVVGAIAFRALFIFVGAELLHHFHFVMYIFGIVLIYAAYKTVFSKSRDEGDSLAVKLSRRIRSSPELDGGKLFTVKNGVRMATPLFLCIIVIELTDIVFAFDSIPACLSVSTDMFIVYTSNIFAILGLRSLYFALRGGIDKLRYMKYGLGMILAFVGVKMLLGDVVDVPVVVSLLVIVGVLFITIAASLYMNKKTQKSAV